MGIIIIIIITIILRLRNILCNIIMTLIIFNVEQNENL
jgi:hypothetical protein